MLRNVICVLVADADPLNRRAIARVTQVPGLDEVVLAHREAETQAEALGVLCNEKVDVAIIDPVLGSDPSDRRGVIVVWTAYERGIPVIVHTAQRLEDPLQRELVDKKIPRLVKSVDPLMLNDIAARRALGIDKPVAPLYDALRRLANALRALSGERPKLKLSEVLQQAAALAVSHALLEHLGNKSAAAKSLGEDRDYLRRRLADLPRDRSSGTRLRADSVVKASPPPDPIRQRK
jgi:DNA-binding NtrC family response regulator